jgi:hypothetical protein
MLHALRGAYQGEVGEGIFLLFSFLHDFLAFFHKAHHPFAGFRASGLADLALIGAAQRVEHYEISAYTTAKNLAQQLRHSAVVALLAKSLAEEENADMLLNQIARTLMSVAKMPEAIEQSAEEA